MWDLVFPDCCNYFNISDCCSDEVKKVMHVQSISHWAPANIGPYSQVVQVGHFFYLLFDDHFFQFTDSMVLGAMRTPFPSIHKIAC